MDKTSQSASADSTRRSNETSSEPQRKRTRVHYNQNNNNNNNNLNNHEQSQPGNNGGSLVVAIPSMEAMLAAPPEIIYRTVGPKHNPRALLTAAEAECLLKVALAAQELDILLQVAEESLNQQRFCRTYKQRLWKSKNPFLYPIISIVHQLEIQARPELQHVQHRLSELLSELSVNAAILRQSAEQNWTLAESLVHAFDTVESLSQEQSLVQAKRSLAELEEELAQRIEKIVALPDNKSTSQKIIVQRQGGNRTSSGGGGSGACRRLFPDSQRSDTSKKNRSLGSTATESIADLAFHLFHIDKESIQAEETKASTVIEEGDDSGSEEQAWNDEGSTFAKTVIQDQEGTMVGAMVGGTGFCPAFTQPKGNDDDSATCFLDKQSGTLSETILQNLQNNNSSQTSAVNQSNAAEALTVLALGGP